MSRWDEKERYKTVRQVKFDEVRSYMENEFEIKTFDGYNFKNNNYDKTFVIRCGHCDGENIDLFDLQDWFDQNREWIDDLREEIK